MFVKIGVSLDGVLKSDLSLDDLEKMKDLFVKAQMFSVASIFRDAIKCHKAVRELV